MQQIDIPHKRLNPFVLPSETTIRFTLLIMAVVMLAVNLSNLVRIVLNFLLDPDGLALARGDISQESLEPTAASYAAWFEKSLGKVGFWILALVIVFVIAWIIYRAHPKRICRKRQLIQVTGGQYPSLTGELEHLTAVAKLDSMPAIAMKEGLTGQRAQSFGFRGKYQLGLDGGMRLLLCKSSAKFKAIILHELAHIANHDIEKTYFADAIWRAVIYSIAIPLIIIIGGITIISWVVTILSDNINIMGLGKLAVLNIVGFIIITLIILGVPLGFIAYIRAGLLSVREYYADSRAALFGAEPPLLDILENIVVQKEKKTKLHINFHPTASQRLQMLRNPTGLFLTKWDIPFFVGILLAFVTSGIQSLYFPIYGVLQGFLQSSVEPLLIRALSSDNLVLVTFCYIFTMALNLIPLGILIILCTGMGYLISGTIGIQIQRESIINSLSQQKGCGKYIRLAWLSILVSIGFEIGALMIPPYQLSPLGAMIGGVGEPFMFVLVIPWIIGFAFISWLCFLYTSIIGEKLFGKHTGFLPPKRQNHFLTSVASVLLGLFYLPMLAGRIWITSYDPLVNELLINTVLIGLPVAMFVFLGVCLATWLFVIVQNQKNPRKCPYCGKISKYSIVIGKVCEQCNQDLAPWLFGSSHLLNLQ